MFFPCTTLDLHDFDFHTVYGAQNRRRDDLFGRTAMSEPTAVQDRHAPGAEKSLVGIVCRQDHSDTTTRERLDLRQHAHLVAKVEAGGGLVHYQHLGFLRQGASDQGELPFTATYFRIRAISQAIDAEKLQQPFRQLNVSRRWGMEQTDPCGPSHQDDFTNSKRKKSQLRLRHVAKESRQALRRPSVDGIAVCHNSAAKRGDEP